MHNQTPLLEVEDLVVDFETAAGTFNAVRGASLTLNQGDAHAIIGESGSGKSVTAAAILGLIDSPPGFIRSGDIRFRGRSILSLPRAERRKLYGRHVSMIFQDPAAHLNPVYPVGWQIAEVCRIHGVTAGNAKRQAVELMERVGIADAARRYRAFPHQFSGGQRQRIMIAMAIAMRPEVLVADEPTTALDVTVQAQILQLIREIQQERGTALLLITHDLGVAADIAWTVSVMHRGRFVEAGTLREVFRAPQHAYTQRLLNSAPPASAKLARDDAELLIDVRNVSINYGAVRAVSNIDVQLRQREIVCLVGESGSGKSTIASAILRLRRTSEGSIRFRGREIGELSGTQLDTYRRSVQAVFQDPFNSLNPRLRAIDVISEPWLIQKGTLPRRYWRQRAAELLESVGLTAADLDKYPSEFSGGQRQRVAIARALALESEVIVCDEAVSALDMSVQGQIIRLLQELRDRMGVALLFITHDLALVRNFADRVIVMHCGKIVEQGETDRVFSDPQMMYTRRLLAACPVPDPDLQQERRAAFNRLVAEGAAAAPVPIYGEIARLDGPMVRSEKELRQNFSPESSIHSRSIL